MSVCVLKSIRIAPPSVKRHSLKGNLEQRMFVVAPCNGPTLLGGPAAASGDQPAPHGQLGSL